MTPRYRAKAPVFVRQLIAAGEEFESKLPPGRNWEPLNAEAEAAVAKFRDKNANVLAIVDRLDPPPRDYSAVRIPEDWQHMSSAKRRGLARKLGAQANVRAEDANSFIEAELERRAHRAA